MKTETRRVAELTKDPRNARKHDSRNLLAIKNSLERFGQQKPIVIREDGQVVAGNGTLQAASDLDWEVIEVVVTRLEDEELTAYALADNRTSDLSEWEDVELSNHLRLLEEEDASLLFDLGWTERDVELAYRQAAEAEEDMNTEDSPGDDMPEESSEIVSEVGDVWLLGGHRITCGDSTDPATYDRLFAEGEVAQLLATDPPYGIDYTARAAVRPGDSASNTAGKSWEDKYIEVESGRYGEFVFSFLANCIKNCVGNVPIFVWHADKMRSSISDAFQTLDVLWHQTIIWVKPAPTQGRSLYKWQHESCLFGWPKGNKPRNFMKNELTTVWPFDWGGAKRNSGDHPTQKPIRIFTASMEAHTREGDLVLEPFSGSGSQLIAAESIGRRCRAIELSPIFVDLGVRRWQEYTGKEARLGSIDGPTFEEVRDQRLSQPSSH